MKIALSMWSVHQYWYDNTWDMVDFIEFVSTTKAEGVELLSMFWRNKEEEIPRVEQALQRTSLQVASFSASNNLAITDEVRWQEQVKDITDSVDMAVRFGAKVVRVFSGDKAGDTSFEEAKSQIIKGLKKAAEYAQAQGVTLCLENHGLFAGKAHQVREVIEAVGSPALRSTFDTGNFLLVGENPSEAIGKLKDYVSHVHFKDFQKVDDDYPGHAYASTTGEKYVGKIAGEGEVDLRYILRALKDANYNGWLTVEFEGEEEPKRGSTESIDNLVEILRTL
jgi:sugar phosphate isomerase/epimerase